MDTTEAWMTAEPLSAHPDTSIAQCAVWLIRHRIRHLPVADANGKPVGLLTDDAVFSHGALTGNDQQLWIPKDQSRAELTADGAAASIEVLVDRDTPTDQTLRLIQRSSQDAAVVRGPQGELAGLVTEHDGLRVAAQLLEKSPKHVRDHGSTPVASTTRLEPAGNALEHMLVHGVRHLVVLDPAGHLAGIIARSDLRAAHVRPHDERTVGQLMRQVEPITIGDAQPLVDAAYSMLQNKVGCLPVLDDDGAPVRILTRFDLIQAALDALH